MNMKKPLKIFLIVTGMLLGTAVLMVTAASFYLNTDHARALIINEANKHISGNVSVQKHYLSLVKGRVEILDIVIRDELEEKLAVCNRVVLEFSWPELLHGLVRIQSATFYNPEVRLGLLPDRSLNLMKVFSGTFPDKGPHGFQPNVFPPLIIDSFQIEEGSLGYFNSKKELLFSLENLKINASVNLLNQSARIDLHKLRVSSPDLEAEASGSLSGHLENPEAFLNLKFNKAEISGYLLDHIEISSSLKNRVIAIDLSSSPAGKGTIKMEGGIDLQHAFPKGFFRTPGDISEISSEFKILIDSVDLYRIHRSATGIVNGNLRLQGKGALDKSLVADIDLFLKARQVSLNPEARPVDVLLDVSSRWDKGRLIIEKLTANAGSTRIAAKGTISPEDNTIRADLACLSDNLSESLLPLGIKGASGSLKLDAVLSGGIDLPEFSFRLQSKGLGFRDVQIGALNLDARLQTGGILSISSLSLKNRESELTGKGGIRFYFSRGKVDSVRPLAFTAALRKMDPGVFLKTSRLKGTIDGNIIIEGKGKEISGSISFSGKNLTYDTIRIGNAKGDLKFFEGLLQIQRLYLQNRKSSADVTGSVLLLEKKNQTFNPRPPFSLSVSSKALFAEDFVDFMQGRISLDADIERVSDQITGSGILNAEKLDTGFQKFLSVQTEAKLKDKKLIISRLNAVVAQGEALESSGWIAFDRTFSFDLKADSISFSNITALSGKWPGQGKLFLNLSGNGSLDRPVFKGNALFNPLRYNNLNWDNSSIELDMSDDLARIHLKSPVSGLATYHIRKKDFTAALDFLKVDLAPFLQMTGYGLLGGNFSGNLAASGNLDSLKSLKARANFSELLLSSLSGDKIMEGRNLKFSFEDEAIVISQNRMTLLNDGYIDIGGRLRPADFRDGLVLKAEVPLHGLGAIRKGFSGMSGSLLVSARLKGPWHKPDIEATADIRKAGLYFLEGSHKIHDVNGRIMLDQDGLTIEKLDGRFDTGILSLNGKADLDWLKIRKMDFRLSASQIVIDVPESLSIRLNADIGLYGNAQSPMVKGEIVVLEGLYYKNVDFNPLKLLTSRYRSFEARKNVEFPDFMQNILLDVRIPPRNQFVADNNIIQLYLSPDMTIRGTLQNPVVHGRTRIDSGLIQYQGNTFVIKNGFIVFKNPYTFETVIDIQSQAEIRTWKVFLDISGHLDQLEIKLSSSPFLDDNELLSLVLTGKIPRDLTGRTGSSGTMSSQKMLADLLSSSVGSALKNASGLDILEVDSNAQSRLENEDPLKITFGKIISPQITIKYTVENKRGESVQRAITEYMLVENLLLSGFQDNRGVFGGEIKFRHEFR